MNEQPGQPNHLALRASDADRERIAKTLHDALAEGRLTLAELDERLQAVYAAKTFGDLAPLTADLPAAAAQVSPIPSAESLPDSRIGDRIGGSPGATVSVGVLSGFERKGSWVLPPTHTAVAIMGGGSLNLCEARFAEQESVIYVFALMGGVEIIVPDDVTCHVEGIGFMGGFNDGANGDAGPGRPVLHVRGFAMMGGVDIRRPKKRERRQLNS